MTLNGVQTRELVLLPSAQQTKVQTDRDFVLLLKVQTGEFRFDVYSYIHLFYVISINSCTFSIIQFLK